MTSTTAAATQLETGKIPPAGTTGRDNAIPWIRRIAAACWRHRGVVLLSLAAAIIGVSLQAVGPLIVKVIIDDAVAGTTQRLTVLIAALMAIYLLTFGTAFVRRYFGGKLALNVQFDIRQAVFSSVSRLDGGKQDSLRVGQIASRAITDLQLITGLLMQTPLSVGSVIFAVLSLAAMLWLSPTLTLIALVVAPTVAIVLAISRKKLFPATLSAQQQAADVAQHVEETVSGVRVVKGFGQEDRETATLIRAAKKLYAKRLRAASLSAVPAATASALPAAGQIAVLGAGGLLALNGVISLGTFIAFAAYLSALISPARMLASLVVQAQLTRAGAQRIYEIIDAQPEINSPDHPESLPPGPLNVNFSDVHFGYTKSEPILNGLSLDVDPGETLAIIGPSGSGKSTISLLLPRFYDTHGGSIRVGNHDIRRLSLPELRKSIGIVFEEAFLFSSSIRDNIAYGKIDATDEEVVAAARAAEADEFIEELPNGYDTIVGERGLTLSGGQRQRLSLARALITNPQILVLDDATSAIDAITEAAIHSTLKSVTAERTTILIAHRRSTLSLADRIAVVDNGHIIDIGTAQELERRCELFRQLVGGTGDRVDEKRRDTSLNKTESNKTERNTNLWPDVVETEDNPIEGEEKLPPATATPQLSHVDVTAPDPHFKLSRLLRPVRGLLFGVIALFAVDALAGISLPALYRYGVDSGVQAGVASAIVMATIIGIIVVSLDWFVIAYQTKLTARTGESVLYLLRVRSYAHLQRLGLDYYERELSGRIMTRMTTDVDALSTFLQTGLGNAVVSALTLVGITIALVVTDVSLAVYAMAILPILVVATIIFRRLSFRAYTEARERASRVNADMQENLSGLRLTQAYVQEERTAENFASYSNDFRLTRLRAQKYVAIYFPLVTFLSSLAEALVLWVGANRVADGTLSVGVLLAFILYLGLFFAPIQQLSSVFDGYQQALVGLRRIGDLLRTPSSIKDPDIPRVITGQLEGKVSFAEVGFSYAKSANSALTDINLSVSPGETIALVGTTGAGKSTLVKLIPRFYDVSSGKLRVDDVSVDNYRISELRHRIGIVPQEAHLFSGTIADNIRYGRPEASNSDVEEAATSVGALSGIAALPHGFRQQVGERGKNLSAGQRQLVALARAELIKPNILLLDEATAALDSSAEIAVLQATDRVARQRTTFVIAHRLATAARADFIVVLKHGRIIERGTHDELIAARGAYFQLWQISGNAVIP